MGVAKCFKTTKKEAVKNGNFLQSLLLKNRFDLKEACGVLIKINFGVAVELKNRRRASG